MTTEDPKPGAILLVDDEIQISRTLGEFLRRRGYAVAWYADSREALASVRAADYALLILDINMPYVDGFEIARAARRRSPETRILFVTGTVEVDKLGGRLVEFPDALVLRKPFDLHELLRRIEEAGCR